MIRHVSASEARSRIHGGREIAFLDLREAGPFSEGHPLFAISCPFSLFEARVGLLVPSRSAPVLLLDAGDGLADVA
ncbi:MAG: rhodanese, partial [Alphaproteobacteria bacterium]|nr:rhodanese [Alphaproteobacteria bacterium]